MKWWKRFAFFDRDSYNLPPIVRDDIFPAATGGGGTSQEPLFQSSLARQSNDDNDNDNDNTTRQEEIPKGDLISLAIINGAGVPLASIQSSSDPTHGVNGMIRTLAACSKYRQSFTSAQEGDDQDGTLSSSLPSESMLDMSKDDMFWFSSTGQTLSIPKGAQRSGNIDGSLVLAFLSSRMTSRVHCIDFTVRCNPVSVQDQSLCDAVGSNGGNGMLGNEGGTNGGMVVDVGKSGGNTNGEKEQELDGWRGYFDPFAHDYIPTPSGVESDKNNGAVTVPDGGAGNSTTRVSSSSTSSGIGSGSGSNGMKSNIVQLAVCSDHETDNITLGKNIYVACVTNAEQSVGVTVHRNPHLYLNDSNVLKECSRSSSSKMYTSKVTPKVECFQPQGIFDYESRGRPVCVDIKTGLVVVGTDTGMIIVYQFHPVSSGANASQGTLGGCNGTNKLTVLMELPPPTGGGGIGGGKSLTGSSPSSEQVKGGEGVVNGAPVNEDVALKRNKYSVTSLKLVLDKVQTSENVAGTSSTRNSSYKQAKLYVTYSKAFDGDELLKNQKQPSKLATKRSSAGVCCYELGLLGTGVGVANTQLSPKTRYDLDGRGLISSCLCDLVISKPDMHGNHSKDQGREKLMVAREDGLYTYSSTEKISVSPIDGSKISMCSVPPPPSAKRRYSSYRSQGTSLYEKDLGQDGYSMNDLDLMQNASLAESGASYVLLASTDVKSGRDAVDIYDLHNKLVAFHLLLSPGHRALRAVAITTSPRSIMDGKKRGGLSTALIVTSGGSIVTLTEKVTSDKVSLLVQKNLFSAAISMAFADPNYLPSDITSLFRKHAEHLYRKGDFSASMDQYLYTIGSLEPSYVIFRFLDAPKIPLLTKYLEALRERNIATTVHIELLRTCYLKLNDVTMADQLSASLSKAMNPKNSVTLVSELLHNPIEALSTLCSFDAPQAVEVLKTHGVTLAKSLPKETAGVVISLCDGVYTPTSVSGSDATKRDILKESLEPSDRSRTCDYYPVHLFSSAFLESPKLLRVILSHCYKNRREMTPALKRMLLELTLEEWNIAKKSKDVDKETMRRDEAIAMLSDPAASLELGDYEALVIAEQQDFVEGIIMLYEKLQMVPLLLEKYSQDGNYKARRQMLALCRSDPELLADVLGHFVTMASEKSMTVDEDQSINSDTYLGELMDDIKEALSMTRALGTLPPVRVARILSGDSVGQFTEERKSDVKNDGKGVPLSVALDYVGSVMDEHSQEVDRLKNIIEEYNKMCYSMESEINELLDNEIPGKTTNPNEINIDEMFAKLMDPSQESNSSEKKSELASEEFWRQMEQTSDRFETIIRFFSKDVLE
jgi:hypothetical protein